MKIGKNFKKAAFLAICLLIVAASAGLVVRWLYQNSGVIWDATTSAIHRAARPLGDYAKKLALPEPTALPGAGGDAAEFRKTLDSDRLAWALPRSDFDRDSAQTPGAARQSKPGPFLDQAPPVASVRPPAIAQATPTPSPRAPPTPSTITGAKSDPDADCRRRLLTKGVVLSKNVDCVDVDTVVKNLATAEYRFNKPDKAYVDESFRVVLVLPTAPGQDVKSPFISAEGPVERRTAPYAQNMEAMLRGDPDLKITPPGPQQRVTTSLAPTTWEWTIIPESAGDKTLIIEVNVQLVIGPDRSRVPLPAIYEKIHVHVPFGHRLSGFGKFMNSALGLAVSLATLAIGVLGILHYLRSHKTEDVAGADLLGHYRHQDDHKDGGGHQA